MIGRFHADKFPVRRLDPIRPIHHDLRPFLFLFLNPGLLDQLAKFQRRPVENRDLALHLDQQIADSIAMKHREKVLDGPDHESFGLQRGGVTGRSHVVQMGGHGRIGRNAAEENPAVGR